MLDKLIDYCVIHSKFEQGIEYAMQIMQYDQARERSHSNEDTEEKQSEKRQPVAESDRANTEKKPEVAKN
ncbi:MAG: hypothetical protein GY796_00270 [Chloroflexi bacterium]|nr:hypothetical protein [Chloroflexota bacterium]